MCVCVRACVCVVVILCQYCFCLFSLFSIQLTQISFFSLNVFEHCSMRMGTVQNLDCGIVILNPYWMNMKN